MFEIDDERRPLFQNCGGKANTSNLLSTIALLWLLERLLARRKMGPLFRFRFPERAGHPASKTPLKAGRCCLTLQLAVCLMLIARTVVRRGCGPWEAAVAFVAKNSWGSD